MIQTVQLMAKNRPELTSRLLSLDNAKPETRFIANMDTSIVQELDLSFTSFETSVLDNCRRAAREGDDLSLHLVPN